MLKKAELGLRVGAAVAVLSACGGAPAADNDAVANASADAPMLSFADAPSADAAPDAVTEDAAVEVAATDAANSADATDVLGADAAAEDTEPDASDAQADVAADSDVDAGCSVASCPPAESACTSPICLADGTCGFAAVDDGKPCTDANACTTQDKCQSGSCVGIAVNCDDGNGCTIDSCKPTSGCIKTFELGPCEDGNGCTLQDQCVSGDCITGASVVCTPSNPCQEAGICEPATGVCPFGALPNGTPCGTNQVCMVGACSVADALPAGALAWFNAASCPVGWETEPVAKGRTVVPADTDSPSATNEAPLAPGEDRVHSHSVSGTIATTSVSFAGIPGCCNSGLATTGTWNVAGSALPASAGIPYVQLRACRKSAAVVYGSAPIGLVAFVDFTCPGAWSPVLSGIHRYIVGTPDGGTNGAVFGGVWGSGHSHAVSFNVPLAGHGIALASGCCAGGYAGSGSAAFTSVTNASTSTLPSLLRAACTPSASGDAPGPIPSGLIAFFTANSCPSGWTPAKSVSGRLIVGAANGVDVGKQVGQALSDQEYRGHSHDMLVSVQPPDKSIAGGNGANSQAADNAKADGMGTSDGAASGMPFIQWLACEKN